MKNNIILFSFLMGMLLVSCGQQDTVVVIETDFGTMKAKLYDSTPAHRDNFIKLAEADFYDGLLFHRVMSGFMIQGGDPNSRDAPTGAPLGNGGPGYTIPAKIAAPHYKGTLAAARTPDNVNPNKESSGSQFYIVHGTPITKPTLDGWAKQKGITYNEAQVTKYLEVGGTPQLDMDYTVFGELIDGFDVLDKIAAVPKDGRDRPVQDVKMNVRITKG